ncbi:ABC transporter substrate-binding protein [Leucobacter soli]|uniref:ABC transporter substrate-binding protein n=1 Tax=Leucobacter soli TaxID=2812850 RepID=UPI0036227952
MHSLTAAAALLLASCSSTPAAEEPGDDGSSTETVDTLKIATLLPLTGGLNFLLPPVEAGISLALSEIEEAGGVLGNPVEIVYEGNEADGDNRPTLEASAADILASDAAFVLGAMSTGSSQHVYEDITGAGILMGSPSNTGAIMTGVSPFYFRTAPSDSIQGSTLASLILGDGKATVGFLTFQDPYGTGLRDRVQELVEEGGAEVVYGGKGTNAEFAANTNSFSAEVTALKDSGAEAIVIITFDEVKSILPELMSQGLDLSNVYLVDGNLVDFTDLDEGVLDGAQGTKPGYEVDEDFRQQLIDAYTSGELADTTYGPEAYDLVNLVALAAEKAGDASAAAIQAQLRAVSGANGGTECNTFAECRDLIAAGEEIHYVARAGVGPLNEQNDPSTAWIGIYKYGADSNAPVFVRSEEGQL